VWFNGYEPIKRERRRERKSQEREVEEQERGGVGHDLLAVAWLTTRVGLVGPLGGAGRRPPQEGGRGGNVVWWWRCN